MGNEALTLQLLQWIGQRPRAYGEAIEAWRTSCPRLTIWEDALSSGLVERIPGATLADAKVRVTALGFSRLGDRLAGSAREMR